MFHSRGRPRFVLAMGGFISAPPILAANVCGAKTFLHESNSIPGRANRWLARRVDGAFVYFPTTAVKMARAPGGSRSACRCARNFSSQCVARRRGRQWAWILRRRCCWSWAEARERGKVNELVLRVAPQLRAGRAEASIRSFDRRSVIWNRVRARYQALGIPAVVHAFLERDGDWRWRRRTWRSAGPERRRWPNWRRGNCPPS